MRILRDGSAAAMLKNLSNVLPSFNRDRESNTRRLFFVWAVIIQLFITSLFLLFYLKNQSFTWDTFNAVMGNWDARHYLFLAEYWYQTTGDEANFIAFFPLYPSLISFVSIFVPSYVLSGILVTSFFSISAYYFFFQLLQLRGYSTYEMKRIALLIMFSPISIYFFAIYTESLFLFLTVLFFYFLEKKQLWLAAVTGFLASLSRMMGVTLILPFLWYVYYEQETAISWLQKIKHKILRFSSNISRSNQRNKYSFSVKKLFSTSAQTVIILTGFLVYLGINAMYFNNPLHYLDVQKSNWHKEPIPPIEKYLDTLEGLQIPIDASSFLVIDRLTVVLFPAIFGVFFLLTLKSPGEKRIRFSWVIWSLLEWLIVSSQSYLLSSTRYLFIIFPFYLVLFEIGKRHRFVYTFILITFALLSLQAHYVFSTGGFVY